MKKILCVFSIFVLLLGLCACNNGAKEKACEKADALLESESNDVYWYEGEYQKVDSTYYYCVFAVLTARAESSDYFEYVKVMSTQDVANELYPQLEDILAPANIPVLIVLGTRDGEIFAHIENGTITWVE